MPHTHPNDHAAPQLYSNATQGGTHTQSDEGGLTKREYFAARAMQGLVARPGPKPTTAMQFAHDAVVAADALIDELNGDL